MVSGGTVVPLRLFESQMSVEEFGLALLTSQDLDPVYVMLYKADLPKPRLARWLLAYWWFYHSGIASRLAETVSNGEFFSTAISLASNRAPRGTERRHFRGAKCVACINWFSKKFPDAIDAIEELESHATFESIKDCVMNWPMFGPWIAFKVADMLETVWGAPVHFNIKDVLELYDQPKKAALQLAAERQLPDAMEVVIKLQHYFDGILAPPRKTRGVGIQEIETILCKWKSHCNGHYPVGKDTKEVRHHLENYGPLAKQLTGYLP